MTWEVGVCSSGDPQDNGELSQPCASDEFRLQERLLATSGVYLLLPLHKSGLGQSAFGVAWTLVAIENDF